MSQAEITSIAFSCVLHEATALATKRLLGDPQITQIFHKLFALLNVKENCCLQDFLTLQNQKLSRTMHFL